MSSLTASAMRCGIKSTCALFAFAQMINAAPTTKVIPPMMPKQSHNGKAVPAFTRNTAITRTKATPMAAMVKPTIKSVKNSCARRISSQMSILARSSSRANRRAASVKIPVTNADRLVFVGFSETFITVRSFAE